MIQQFSLNLCNETPLAKDDDKNVFYYKIIQKNGENEISEYISKSTTDPNLCWPETYFVNQQDGTSYDITIYKGDRVIVPTRNISPKEESGCVSLGNYIYLRFSKYTGGYLKSIKYRELLYFTINDFHIRSLFRSHTVDFCSISNYIVEPIGNEKHYWVIDVNNFDKNGKCELRTPANIDLNNLLIRFYRGRFRYQSEEVAHVHFSDNERSSNLFDISEKAIGTVTVKRSLYSESSVSMSLSKMKNYINFKWILVPNSKDQVIINQLIIDQLGNFFDISEEKQKECIRNDFIMESIGYTIEHVCDYIVKNRDVDSIISIMNEFFNQNHENRSRSAPRFSYYFVVIAIDKEKEISDDDQKLCNILWDSCSLPLQLVLVSPPGGSKQFTTTIRSSSQKACPRDALTYVCLPEDMSVEERRNIAFQITQNIELHMQSFFNMFRTQN